MFCCERANVRFFVVVVSQCLFLIICNIEK